MKATWAVGRYGMAVCMALAAADVCRAQEVIYVRAPATSSGHGIADGQRLAPGVQIATGAGGVVVVELRNWPAKEGGPCTLFVIASGGSSATIPVRSAAKPRECRDSLANVDRAMTGAAISTSVLLFAAGPGDSPGTTEEALYERLPRRGGSRRGSLNPAAEKVGRPGTAVAAANTSIGLRIDSATYGANCGAPVGNQTATLAGACTGRLRCDYVVDYLVIGDPAPGCAKDYRVTYKCTIDGPSNTVSLDGEAGFKKLLRLGCQ